MRPFEMVTRDAPGDTSLKPYGTTSVMDIVCIGAGPSALTVLHAAKKAGLHALALDKGPLCSALLQHPTYMQWFSTADKLELGGLPLLCEGKSPTRREYLKYCRHFVRYFDLHVVPYHEVSEIVPLDGLFHVVAHDRFQRTISWKARNVVVATGFYGQPRLLQVPGADLPKVAYRYTEAHPYFQRKVLVVGGGSSAAEAALELYREGAEVTVVLRRSRFHTKYWIEPDIENRIAEGSIACYRNAELVEILPDSVRIRSAQGDVVEVENEFVLALTGYVPDTRLLEKAGAVIEAETKKPVLTEHLETTVPGLYVAGTLCAGCETNTIFVENSRDHGPRIVNHICAVNRTTVAPLEESVTR